MSHANRPLSGSLRPSSVGPGSLSSSSQSPMLVARINEKKAELESLRQLRDLSGDLAAQMQALEGKISTLSNGTEAVATVLSNWHNVMRAINMASMRIPAPSNGHEESQDQASQPQLPQTLVRIPAEPQKDATESTEQTEDR